jgi:hypothetical protein
MKRTIMRLYIHGNLVLVGTVWPSQNQVPGPHIIITLTLWIYCGMNNRAIALSHDNHELILYTACSCDNYFAVRAEFNWIEMLPIESFRPCAYKEP